MSRCICCCNLVAPCEKEGTMTDNPELTCALSFACYRTQDGQLGPSLGFRQLTNSECCENRRLRLANATNVIGSTYAWPQWSSSASWRLNRRESSWSSCRTISSFRDTSVAPWDDLHLHQHKIRLGCRDEGGLVRGRWAEGVVPETFLVPFQLVIFQASDGRQRNVRL